MNQTLTISPVTARRLAITRQRLAGPWPKPGRAAMLGVVRDIGCLQIDPISAVARSHLLVMASRMGPYPVAELDALIYEDKQLFEYWAHCASFVLTEDFPLFHPLMRRYPERERTRSWLDQNDKLRRYVLGRLRRSGPLLSRELEEDGIHPAQWVSTGWTSGRNISRMLDALWLGGRIMVAGRDGLQKRWDLAERVLPEWTPRGRLSERERERQAVLKALRGLGVGTPQQIKFHFTRGDYPNLKQTLADLRAEGRLTPVRIAGEGKTWPGEWLADSQDLALIERLEAGEWSPRTTLLSPFDNLICDRARTELMWDFFFRIEIYTPAAKRRWGYYVLPILHGDRIIGRVDPTFNREHGRLEVNAVFAETGAPAAGAAVRQAVERLARFLEAGEIRYNKQRLPARWKRDLLA